MSSFLQDFDLREGGLHPQQDHYRTYNLQSGVFDEHTQSLIVNTDEATPMKYGTREEESKRLITNTTMSNR